MAGKLPIWDQRMIMLMMHCIDNEIASTQKEFLESVGMIPAGLKQIRDGKRSFTLEQIRAACVKYKVNANWILGLDNDMKMKKSPSTITQLKDLVRSLEAEFKHVK